MLLRASALQKSCACHKNLSVLGWVGGDWRARQAWESTKRRSQSEPLKTGKTHQKQSRLGGSENWERLNPVEKHLEQSLASRTKSNATVTKAAGLWKGARNMETQRHGAWAGKKANTTGLFGQGFGPCFANAMASCGNCLLVARPSQAPAPAWHGVGGQ